MKKMMLVAAACCMLFGNASAEEKKDAKVFTVIKENPITSIKNQSRSGTCWCYSSLAFLESELLRMGKGEYDLGESFVVYKTMVDRGVAAVRMHGDVSFSQGGSFYDVLYCLKNYGMLPQEAMAAPGSLYGDTLYNHNELDAVAGGYVRALAQGKLKTLSPIWKKGLERIYDTYMGEIPEKFSYKGKEYTPKSFAESLGLKADDYISLTSYTHHPFYEPFVVEVQDNWRWAQSYNLPLDEFMEVMDNAVRKGYTFAWGADVSEKGFRRDGVAVVPADGKSSDMTGSDAARWTGSDKTNDVKPTQGSDQEKTITQEMRQIAYDNWETTDDHGMQIYGLAKDQDGNEYFMVKNSWGNYNEYKGCFYASKPYVAYKTMNIVVHKDALPKAILKKLGLK